jgi:hypothetical protein
VKTSKSEHPSETGRFVRKKLLAKPLVGELLLYDEEQCTAHCVAGLVQDLWNLCERERSVTELTRLMREKWPDISEHGVLAALSQMESAGLLVEPSQDESLSASRRDVLRRIGVAAVVGIPIAITSVLVPPVAAAASCATFGQTCSDARPCCPGLGLVCRLGICGNI